MLEWYESNEEGTEEGHTSNRVEQSVSCTEWWSTDTSGKYAKWRDRAETKTYCARDINTTDTVS
jgi:hypothetical protein